MNTLFSAMLIALSLGTGTPASPTASAASEGPQKEDAACADTFDRTDDCLAPEEVLPQVKADKKGADIVATWNPEKHTSPLQLFFLGTGGALAGAALMSTAALISSQSRLQKLLEDGHYREDLHGPYLRGTQFLGATTGFFWGAAALVSAAGLSLWVFNPNDGTVGLGKKAGQRGHE
jgi:hypothetical protein